jgi:hypothetical protein
MLFPLLANVFIFHQIIVQTQQVAGFRRCGVAMSYVIGLSFS